MPAPATPAAGALRRSFRRTLFKAAIASGLAAALLAVLARAAFYAGWLRPIRIAGGSMAETLVGDHWRIHCPRCGIWHRCDVEQLPRDHRVVCPNCGSDHDAKNVSEPVRGQRVFIDRWPAFRGNWRAQRGAVVAVRRDDAPSGFAVKRLIGFPGETIAIRDGDVWLGPDRIYRKTWNELMAVAIPVHNDRFRPAPTPHPLFASSYGTADSRIEESASSGIADGQAPRTAGWRPVGEDSGWESTPHGYRWRAKAPHSNRSGRLEFHTAAGNGTIRDFDAYNQALSRRLEMVDDLILCLDAVLEDSATLELELRPARRPGVRFEFSKSLGCQVWSLAGSSPRLLKRIPLPVVHAAGHRRRLGVAHCDRQAIVAVHHREWTRIDLDMVENGSETGSETSSETSSENRDGTGSTLDSKTRSRRAVSGPSVAIGAAGRQVELADLWIGRDIHYLTDMDRDGPHSWRLGEDEWFVLGDNAAASTDSRAWRSNHVRSRHFVGVVHPL